jgi:hypothetical protein
MNKYMKMVAATALLAGSGFATIASADVATMTCGEFKAMDDAGRMGAAHELMHWIADAANFEASAPLKRYFEDSPEKAEVMDDRLSDPADKGFTHNDMKIEIEAHCKGMAPDTNVIERLKSHT